MPAGQVCAGGHSGTGLCRKVTDFIHGLLSPPLPGSEASHAQNAPRHRTLGGLSSLSHALSKPRTLLAKMEPGSAIDSELRDLCFGCRKSPSLHALVWGRNKLCGLFGLRP